MSKYWTCQKHIMESQNVVFEEIDNKRERAHHYTDIAISNAKNGLIDEAKIGLMIAATLFESMQLHNYVEKVSHALIALYDKEGDRDSILDIYQGLSIYFNLQHNGDKVTQYIRAGNGLIVEIIGKKDPSPEELFEYDQKRAKENLQCDNTCQELKIIINEQLLALQQ